MRLPVRRPSPAMVVAFIALFVALAGTGYAATATTAKKPKHADAKKDTALIKKLAPKLSVKHAKTANSAKTANTATTANFATTAGTATSASDATIANNANNANNLGGQSPSAFEPASKIVTSKTEAFFQMGQQVTLTTVGHFTFTASCSNDGTGQPLVEFDVTANTTADLDGSGPEAAGTVQDIHQNSDSLDGLTAGAFDQVGSASSSTEIAEDGQEVDVFYNDGVNWPAAGGGAAHDCFAGVTGIEA